MIAASCSYQGHRHDHPNATQPDQRITRNSLRPLRRDAQVEEEHGCFRHGDRTYTQNCD